MGPGDRKLLNKLVLGEFATVQKQYRGQIRAGIHNLKCGKVPAYEAGAYVEGLKGSIGHVRLFDTRRAAILERQLQDALLSMAAGAAT